MNSNLRWLVLVAVLVGVALASLLGGLSACGDWLDDRVEAFRTQLSPDSMFFMPWQIYGPVGVVLFGLTCGMVSSLVVSNRMAFFSDAMAHCAFAGVALGLLLYMVGALGEAKADDAILGVMILFGIGIGLAIAFVREKTTLANDTVIGVFFAGAMGLGALILGNLRGAPSQYSPEAFLFGNLLALGGLQIVQLVLLLILTGVFLFWWYNECVFVSFNPSLARSRDFSVRAGNYLFIVLLGLIVNIGLQVCGVLLINALLIVPAATAGNLARNLRQFFWYSTVLSIIAGLGGFFISYAWAPVIGGNRIDLKTSGAIVVLGVLLFFASMIVGRWMRGARASVRPSI